MHTFLLILFSFISQYAFAYNYGDNNQNSIENFDQTPFAKAANSVGAMVMNSKLKRDDKSELYTLEARKLSQKLLYSNNGGYEAQLCSGEKNENLDAQAHCTFSLVGPKTILTAAHCVLNGFRLNIDWDNPDDTDCSQLPVSFLFDYNAKTKLANGPHQFNKDQVYSCHKIKKININYQFLDEYNPDYALIELDREVVGRSPLKLASTQAPIGTEVISIGHPNGVEQQLIDDARLMTHKNENRSAYAANLDAHPGISGAPVFNRINGEIIGIVHEAGQPFFLYDKDKQCMKYFSCHEQEGRHLSRCQATLISKSTSMDTEILGNVENQLSQSFEQYEQRRLALIAEQEARIQQVELWKDQTQRLNYRLDERLKSREGWRRFGRGVVRVKNHMNRPFSWSSGFIKGLFSKKRSTNISKYALDAVLYNMDNFSYILSVLREAKSEREFVELATKYVEESVRDQLQKAISKVMAVIPSQSELANPRTFHSWLKQCVECNDLIELTSIRDASFYRNLFRVKEQALTLEKNRLSLILAESNKLLLTPYVVGLISSSVQAIYLIPVVATQVGAVIAASECWRKENKEVMKLGHEVNSLSLQDRLLAELVANDQDLSEFLNSSNLLAKNCMEIKNHTYLVLERSRHIGYRDAKNTLNWIKRIFSKKE